MGGFDVVLFDLDNTLSDFEWAKREAFSGLLHDAGIVEPLRYLDTFNALADPLWAQLERGELTLDTLNSTRFQRLIDNTDIDADPAHLAPRFLQWLSKTGGLIDGARDLLDDLHGDVRMGLITNGYSEVQRPRLDHFGLNGYFEAVVVSSEIGHAKPSAAFFDHAFAALGNPDPSTVLVVGDSLSSDIAGGRLAGAATCWFNPAGRPAPAETAHLIDHDVATLADIAPLIRSCSE